MAEVAGPNVAGEVDAVVDGEWVRECIERGYDFKVLDCSWFLHPPSSPHSPLLSGAAFFDVDEVADRSEDKSPSPHMLPSAGKFSEWMRQHGIANDDHLLLYDHSDGLMTASARVWWTCKVFGHKKVSVLAGGYSGWPYGAEIPSRCHISPGCARSVYAATYTPARPRPPPPCELPYGKASNSIRINQELVWTQNEVLDHVVRKAGDESSFILLDARPADRFNGVIDEPRRGVPSGSVPGAVSLPFPELFRKEEVQNRAGQVKTVYLPRPREELIQQFSDRGVQFEDETEPPKKTVAVMCGSGVTACQLALLLYTLGLTSVAVYDGSWTEWAFTTHPKQHLQQLPPDVTPLRKYHH